MKTRSGRWGMLAFVATISLVVAQSAEAKAERGSRSTPTIARSTNRGGLPSRATQLQAMKSRSTAARVVRRPAPSRRTAVTATRRIPARRMVRGYPILRQMPDRSFVRSASTYPPRDVLNLALRAYACGEEEGAFEQPYLTIIDYSLPSVARRLWVLDVRTKRVLFHELVAHGRNSGENFAVAFSNDLGSRQSSIGLYRTEDVYRGQHGGSLRLTGLEPGYNDLAWERAIVMHGARYVSASHAEQYGQLGRSWGCPALPLGTHQRIIERIQGGSAVFVYYPDRTWLRSSRYLHCDARLAQR